MFTQFPATLPNCFTMIDSPVYPDNKGHYIWYKHSIPVEADTQIINEEHTLLYSCESLTTDKPRESIYVKIYLACLVFMILLLLVLPFIAPHAA